MHTYNTTGTVVLPADITVKNGDTISVSTTISIASSASSAPPAWWPATSTAAISTSMVSFWPSYLSAYWLTPEDQRVVDEIIIESIVRGILAGA